MLMATVFRKQCQQTLIELPPKRASFPLPTAVTQQFFDHYSDLDQHHDGTSIKTVNIQGALNFGSGMTRLARYFTQRDVVLHQNIRERCCRDVGRLRRHGFRLHLPSTDPVATCCNRMFRIIEH